MSAGEITGLLKTALEDKGIQHSFDRGLVGLW